MSMINNLEKLLANGQDSALLRYGLGSAYVNAKDYTAAIKHLAMAVQHNPHYSAAWKLYGKALAQLERYDEARTVFEQGIEVAKEQSDQQAVKEMQVFLKRLPVK